MKHKFLAILTSLLFASLACAQNQALIQLRVYSLAKPLDTMKIKALGSFDTKRSPVFLQVKPTEAARLEKMIAAEGGKLISSPSVRTLLGQKASIKMSGDNSVSFEVTPTSKSDTITMQYRLEVSQKEGRTRTTRASSGFARLIQTERMLIIQNPRTGEPGLIVILQATKL